MTPVEVRATCHMVGISPGQIVMVDPDRPYIKMCLENGHLVRTGRERPSRPATEAAAATGRQPKSKKRPR